MRSEITAAARLGRAAACGSTSGATRAALNAACFIRGDQDQAAPAVMQAAYAAQAQFARAGSVCRSPQTPAFGSAVLRGRMVLEPVAQRRIHAGLPTGANGTEGGEDIPVKTDRR